MIWYRVIWPGTVVLSIVNAILADGGQERGAWICAACGWLAACLLEWGV